MCRRPQISREEFAAKYFLNPKKQWIALLPGSRRKEVRLNLSAMVQTARLLQKQSDDFEFVLPVASTLNQDWLREQLALCTAGWSRPSGLRSEPLKNPASAAEVADHKQQARASTHEGPLVHLTDNARTHSCTLALPWSRAELPPSKPRCPALPLLWFTGWRRSPGFLAAAGEVGYVRHAKPHRGRRSCLS